MYVQSSLQLIFLKSPFKIPCKIRLFYEKLTWKIGNTEIKIKTLEYRRRYTLCTYSSFCRCSKKKKGLKQIVNSIFSDIAKLPIIFPVKFQVCNVEITQKCSVNHLSKIS